MPTRPDFPPTPHRLGPILGLLLIGLLLSAGSILAQSGPGTDDTPVETALPPAHLGYGVHVGPHLAAPQADIQAMGMDWIKVYDSGQVDDYPALRVLYRMDLDWPNDWNYFRSEVTRRTQELVQRGVDAIEIHNEPNLSLEWPRGPNAWEYAQMLRVAYGLIKAVDPNVIVVSGGLAPTLTTPDRAAISDLEFAREMLENGAADYFDAFGYHPYGFNQPPEADPYQNELVFRRTERMRALLDELGAADKPIWITEFGWLRSPTEGGLDCTGSPALAGFEWMQVSGAVQAEYTVRAFAYADRNWPWVGPMFLWNLNWQMYDYDIEDACSHLRWYGLLEHDGTPTLAYQAVVSMPRRPSAYLPQVEARPITLDGVELAENRDGDWLFPVAAFCPRVVPVGEFELVNTGWPAAVTFEVLPQTVPVPGAPEVLVSTSTARFGDRVTVYADASDTAPGEYLLVVNLRGTYNGRTVSGHASLRLAVENSPINCQ